MPIPKIDWDEIREGVNDRLTMKDIVLQAGGWTHTIKQGVIFTTERQMWDTLYVKRRTGSKPLETLLGPCDATIRTRLRELGITLKTQGWSRNGTTDKLLRLRDKIKNLTAKEACLKYGIKRTSFYALASKFGIDYLRLKPRS